MATSNYLDLTEEYNANGNVVLDVSLYTSGLVYFYNLSGSTDFLCTNDGGEEEGTVIGSPLTAKNFNAVRLLNLSTNVYDTKASGNSIFKFKQIGKYLKIGTTGVTADKLIVQLQKII